MSTGTISLTQEKYSDALCVAMAGAVGLKSMLYPARVSQIMFSVGFGGVSTPIIGVINMVAKTLWAGTCNP